ncbi:MAG: hypothetical protein N2Z79_02715, partial [Candidatus Omnitrophica bacterium]|nr:hypothetical protein [Candidatus Omnitrophota bacterium]
LVGSKFWKPIKDAIIQATLYNHSPPLISAEDKDLIRIVDTAEEAFSLLNSYIGGSHPITSQLMRQVLEEYKGNPEIKKLFGELVSALGILEEFLSSKIKGAASEEDILIDCRGNKFDRRKVVAYRDSQGNVIWNLSEIEIREILSQKVFDPDFVISQIKIHESQSQEAEAIKAQIQHMLEIISYVKVDLSEIRKKLRRIESAKVKRILVISVPYDYIGLSAIIYPLFLKSLILTYPHIERLYFVTNYPELVEIIDSRIVPISFSELKDSIINIDPDFIIDFGKNEITLNEENTILYFGEILWLAGGISFDLGIGKIHFNSHRDALQTKLQLLGLKVPYLRDEPIVPRRGFRAKKIFVNPHSRSNTIFFNSQSWKELIIALLNRGYSVVLNRGSPDIETEQEKTREILELLGSYAQHSSFEIFKGSLRDLVEFIATQPQAVITIDTSIYHLSILFRIPTVVFATPNSKYWVSEDLSFVRVLEIDKFIQNPKRVLELLEGLMRDFYHKHTNSSPKHNQNGFFSAGLTNFIILGLVITLSLSGLIKNVFCLVMVSLVFLMIFRDNSREDSDIIRIRRSVETFIYSFDFGRKQSALQFLREIDQPDIVLRTIEDCLNTALEEDDFDAVMDIISLIGILKYPQGVNVLLRLARDRRLVSEIRYFALTTSINIVLYLRDNNLAFPRGCADKEILKEILIHEEEVLIRIFVRTLWRYAHPEDYSELNEIIGGNLDIRETILEDLENLRRIIIEGDYYRITSAFYLMSLISDYKAFAYIGLACFCPDLVFVRKPEMMVLLPEIRSFLNSHIDRFLPHSEELNLTARQIFTAEKKYPEFSQEFRRLGEDLVELVRQAQTQGIIQYTGPPQDFAVACCRGKEIIWNISPEQIREIL